MSVYQWQIIVYLQPRKMCEIKHSPLIVLFILAILSQEICSSNDLANGMGKNYEWHTLEDGLKVAEETGKPLMLIIHKSWCGACKSFKPKFASSGRALELSKNFVMVNTMDSDEPADPKYKPDGGYIPRILFLDSSGQVHEEIYNENGNPKYKFYYYEETTVIYSMEKALSVLIPLGSRGDEL